ncbi:MAG: hypothetical protein KDK53_02835 [Maritimibacter sp.]|nr:hypothetical protein [Maritimibacter sp.]
MSRRSRGWRFWLRALLTGPRFERALERNARAARKLDRAVREVLER